MVTINRALLAMCLAGLPAAVAHQTGTAGHHEHGSAQQTQQTGSTEQRQISTVEAQQILKEKGFYDGPIDGIAGPRTSAALREYQRCSGNLSVTGQLDQQTMQHMAMSLNDVEGEGVRARSGEPGSAAGASESGQKMRMSVHEAQQVLKDEGLYQGRIDGIAGPQTRSALRQFQQRQNLPVTGRLDQQTMQQLNVEGERGRTVTPEEQQQQQQQPQQQHEHHEQQQQDEPEP